MRRVQPFSAGGSTPKPATSFPLWWFTLVDWYEVVDRRSRTNGWADGGSMLLGAVLWQWVWIPLGIYFLAKRLGAGGEKSEGGAHAE